MIDMDRIMYLIHGVDRTKDIKYIERKGDQIDIQFDKSNKIYSYRIQNVRKIERTGKVVLNDEIICVNNMPVYHPVSILKFQEYIRICKYDGSYETYFCNEVTFIKNAELNEQSEKILSYLKDISQYTNIDNEKSAFLLQELEDMSFIHPDSILSLYLRKDKIVSRDLKNKTFICPFSYNLSQKKAIEHALYYPVSIIEGPPGTGKTQTILNIIANLITIQNKTVAVVSNNNEAVRNIKEKLEEKGYGFICAMLGCTDNLKDFFSNVPKQNLEGWNMEGDSELKPKLEEANKKLSSLMKKHREKEKLCQQLRNWKLEKDHFDEYYAHQNIEKSLDLPMLKKEPHKILDFMADTSVAQEYGVTSSLRYRLKMLFKYGIVRMKKLNQEDVALLLHLQKAFYEQQIHKLESMIKDIEIYLNQSSFEDIQKEHKRLSKSVFKLMLTERYHDLNQSNFTIKNYKPLFESFIKCFPVILSSTHSIRRTLPKNYLLDYIIIDESSQVDLITGSLALSCCRNVIVVGDTKQLPQITNIKIREQLKDKDVVPAYDYFKHSLLTSLLSLYGENEIPKVTLKEHYRCHPEIIEFCNQKYYQGQLICYTEIESDDTPLAIYKTAPGNHMRKITRSNTRKGTYNQREISVIQDILEGRRYDDNKYGVVTPYRKQADETLKQLNYKIESDTVHKYQGREKDTIIFSTVLDNTRQGNMGIHFVDDSHMVNVAVSRAIHKFILVTDHQLFFKKGRDIADLIRYIQYHTLDQGIIESDIVSVFDLLYSEYSEKLLRLKKKMNPFAKWDSEEIIRVLLDEILEKSEFQCYEYRQQILLKNLLNNDSLLNERETAFVNHRASVDFVIYYKMNKQVKFIIEVDGFDSHENNDEQLVRDQLKNDILKKYNIPMLRLATNGSREKAQIEQYLQMNDK